ncbi:hypothetical protein RHGRI_006335 [Rhododendron griersonianum]|uniref:AAA+ ATPase domain-containing protein n=1 Tax=Rhododendron griersonianum TaxID=479676 RepID=A0AAV6KT48_9ERIC|nr:hypothetical protein RHGRI_006335 [Rhododendron griersonianum]
MEGIIESSVCKAFDEAVKAGTKAGKYVRQYRMYLANLETEQSSLQYRREIIERRVQGARDRGEEIEDAVSRWQEDAGRMENDVQQLIGRVEARMHCFACSCPNIKWRYRLGKQAEEKIAAVKQLAAQGGQFDVISHPRPPPPELEFPSAENYVHLDSRTPILEAIVGALKDPNVKMIGVHGLGGVGKTTLVEKVAKKMLDDGTFKQVPLVIVSKVLNVKEIQKKLADKLNLELKATADENAIAIQLWNKFKNGEKYLVILDDIWEEVDLKAIGIPIVDGTTGCKVVLTSRKEDLLRITMKVDINFPIAELSEGEGWNLFKKKVGKTIESQPEIDSLAQEVCRKCKGLPVAINAIGAALEDKPYHTWKNAFDKLKRHMLTQIEGVDPSVWASLYVSYDMLRSSDAQSCFLLCCLYSEDGEILIVELTRICIARSLLSQNPCTLDEARNAVHTAVDALKSASLLTTGGRENVVRIHDVIRDVGISIARDQDEVFLIDHGAPRWPPIPTNAPSYSAISLAFKDIKRLPSGLVYPQLHTLFVRNSKLSDVEFPDNFFNGMTQLSVLDITEMRMRRLPSSLAKLTNLRMLDLDVCELADIALLKDLKSNLEVLGIRGSSIKALPPEIGQLTSLRVLDLQNCHELMVIPRGVISNLTSLEELYFPQNFSKWEATIDEQQDTSSGENVSLKELRGLLSTGQLTTLHIYIPDVMLLPKEDLIFANLKEFKISVGSIFNYSERLISGRCMLKLEGIQLRNEFIPLVDKAEVVVLRKIEGLKKVFHDRGDGNRFLGLKYLKVTSCVEDLEYLLGESKSSVQSHEMHHLQSFNNLAVLIIKYCKSKYLFSPTIAKGLVHLEKLKVRSCEIMEGIVGFEGRNDKDEFTSEVKFNKLKQLELEDLPNLLSFYAQKVKTRTSMGSTSACAQPLFSEKVVFPVLKRMYLWDLDKITRIWDDQPLSEPEKETKSFSELEDIMVNCCDQLEYVLPFYMLPLLKNLRELMIRECRKMEVIISNNPKEKEATNNNDTIRFPQLKTVKLWNLPNLKSFVCSDQTQLLFSNKVVFPVLKRMYFWNLDKITRIWNDQPLSESEKEAKSFTELEDINVVGCEHLEYVLSFYMLPQLKNLQELSIENCTKVEVIISNNPKEKEATNNIDTIRFPQLKTLTLSSLPNLKSFICSDETQLFFSNKDAFPVLEDIELGKDLKFLRNETSTKEVSIEECGTSGKESDYNGEELDEDLETLTKEDAFPVLEEIDLDEDSEILQDGTCTKEVSMENKMVDTSAAQARKGKDIQKIPWGRLNITREKCRQTRIEQYENYEDIPQSGERSEKDCNVTMKGGMYYEFKRNSRSVKSTILHHQLRNLVWATSKQDVYFMSHFSVTHWSALTCNKTEVLNFSGHVAPCEKHPGSLPEGFTRTRVSTLAVKDRLLVAGGFKGELICKHTSLSPDGKLRIIVGDNPEGMLVDSGTGKMVASLVGHLDFSLASAWHPNGLTFATGNQDKTCRIWDARNLSKSVAALRGNLGTIQSIRYSSDGRFMAMAEPADFVHVFDAKSGYEKEQEIDFFGEISGMSFSPDTESLFIGVCDLTYGSLLEFGRRRNNSCSDSII